MNFFKKLINYKIFFLLIFLILIFFIFFYFKEKNILNKQKKILNQAQKEIKINLKTKKDKQVYKKAFDLKTDSSLTKFVNAKISFENKSYVPKNLEKISGKYIYDAKGGNLKLRKEAKQALELMAKDFYSVFKEPIVVISAYRSYNYQKQIKLRGCPDNLCAKAGYSEHQSGLALDLWEATTQKQFLSNHKLKKYFDWLTENAYKYGFINTYRKGLKIDTYEIEPWHWRFVGEELANYLKKRNLTFAEFYKNY